jgi:hypothetical protein
MKTLKAHFDGKVLVPDEPVDLPGNRPLEVSVVSAEKSGAAPAALDALAALARSVPTGVDDRTDLAAEHDHYLYGTPRRP